MSSFLYHLGLRAARGKRFVVSAWLIVLVLLGSAGVLFGQGTENDFTIPGSSAQKALNHLNRVVPRTGGSRGRLLVVTSEGTRITDPAVVSAVENAVERISEIPQVSSVGHPFAEGAGHLLSEDHRAAMVPLLMDGKPQQISPETKNRLHGITADLAAALGPQSRVLLGGAPFTSQTSGSVLSEVVGVIIALIVLLLMFRSLLAAGMPLITALIGVGITMGGTFLATTVVPISSTAPLLGVMLGLAVGIDYALLILSRHRDQLTDGLEVRESIGRATATAGSAVIFAGMTVMIALLGLFVAGIPFLTVMGIVAAAAVLVAVLIAVTLIPALLAFCGERLRPRSTRWERRSADGAQAPASRHRIAGRWVRTVTRAPVITIVLVVAGLGVCALPAQNLRLTLPSAGDLPKHTQARQIHDAIAEHFGPGYNAQVILIANIVATHDPVGVVNGIADDVRDLAGVAAVPVATPDPSATIGLIKIVPAHGAYSEQTKDLVAKLRSMHGYFKAEYGVSTAVTGRTAVALDVSSRLRGALLPFGALVIGLSLILLAMVFRSIWVPIKATVGYLLSVLAAFGVTSFVFVGGHFADVLNLASTGSVISFFPIVLMGVLFGLAMDYEVFLVTRIREEYVRGGDPRGSIERGFVSASRVVLAAAAIMFAVFAAFVPVGNGAIKPIAFGLAVGVFVDAFVVRMTLVPAVLALLGKHAWWLPAWLERRLPAFDAEGNALAHELRLADWPHPESDDAVNAASLRLSDDRGEDLFSGVDIRLPRGGTLAIEGTSPAARTALLYILAGRARRVDGDLKVIGRVLPQHARAVRRRVALIPCRDSTDPAEDVRAALADGIELILLDDVDLVADQDIRFRLARLLTEPDSDGRKQVSVVLTCTSAFWLSDLLPGDTDAVSLGVERSPQEPARHLLTSHDAELR